MHRATIQTMLWAGAILCLALHPARSYAQSCSNTSVYGTSFTLLNGTITAANSFLPEVVLAREVYDGKGGVSGTYVGSVNGIAGNGALAGAYAVNPDCSGTESDTLTPPSGAPSNFTSSFQLVQGGNAGLSTLTGTGTVAFGQSYRAAADGVTTKCSNALLAGTYSVDSLGASDAFPISRIGQFSLDTGGGIAFAGTMNVDPLGPQAFSGNGGYTVQADCTGTMTLPRGNGLSDTIDFGVVEGGDLVFIEPDPGEVVSGVARRQSPQTVLGQFAFGGGWYTAMYFNNESAGPVSFTVDFIADGGAALTVPALGGSSATVQIPAGGTATIEAPNVGTTLYQGYAVFTLPPGVTGYGVFRQTVPGRPDQEAVVPFASSTTTSRTLLFDETNGLVTAVAVVNPSAAPVNVVVNATDNNGNFVGSAAIGLGAHNKMESAMDMIPGLGNMFGRRGRAVFAVTTGSVVVLGLRFDFSAFTSIPALD
jgi:hypothetical protein